MPFALSASWLICGSLSRYWSQIKGTVSVVSTASWSILNGAGSCGLGSFLPAPRGSRSSSLWIRGLPWWLRGDESTSQCRRCRFRPWVREMPRRRKAGPAEKESGSPREGKRVPRRRKYTHSSTLAWEISWTEEPGGLPSVGSQRVRHDLAWKARNTHDCTHTDHDRLRASHWRRLGRLMCKAPRKTHKRCC